MLDVDGLSSEFDSLAAILNGESRGFRDIKVKHQDATNSRGCYLWWLIGDPIDGTTTNAALVEFYPDKNLIICYCCGYSQGEDPKVVEDRIRQKFA